MLVAAQMAKYKERLVTETITFAPKVLVALLTLLIGLWIASMIVNVARRGLEFRKVDPTLVPFLSSLLGWTLKPRSAQGAGSRD